LRVSTINKKDKGTRIRDEGQKIKEKEIKEGWNTGIME